MKTTISFPPETVLPVKPLLPGAPAYKMADQIHHQIAQFAFEIFCESGRTEGHAYRTGARLKPNCLSLSRLNLSKARRNS